VKMDTPAPWHGRTKICGKTKEIREFRLTPHFVFLQMRLVVSWGHLALLLLGLGLALILRWRGDPEDYLAFHQALEVLLPLVAGFFFVPLILREKEQHTLPLIGVTQCAVPFLFVVRVGITILYMAIFIGGIALVARIPGSYAPSPGSLLAHQMALDREVWPTGFLGGPYGLPAMLLSHGAPVLFLAGLGLASAHLAADARVGYVVMFSVWMFNRAAGRTLSAHPLWRYVYLFVRFEEGGGLWLAPKLVQLALGIGLLVLSWLLLFRLEHFLRKGE